MMRAHVSETRRVITKLRLGLGYNVEKVTDGRQTTPRVYYLRQTPTDEWGQSIPVKGISALESLQ